MKQRISSRLIALSMTLALVPVIGGSPAFAQWRVGNWYGQGFVNPGTGAFSHCAIWVRYRSGITLYFLQRQNLTLFVGMSKPTWVLRPGGNYRMSLDVDGQIIKTARGQVLANNNRRMWLSLGRDNVIRDRLQRGKMLTLINGTQTYRFRLTATSAALARLLRCVQYQGS